MLINREPATVARRALVLTVVAFRGSLEVTDHPRVIELSQRLVPWLDEIECRSELDPKERELLGTPLGQLSKSFLIDANWAGEAAAFFCWTLNCREPLVGVGETTTEHVASVVANREQRKLYVGMLSRDVGRAGLWVFDLGDDGQPVGKARKYGSSG